MTVKQLMDVIDKNTLVEIYAENDHDPLFLSKRNCSYCTKHNFEKIKDKVVVQITAPEEDLVYVYIATEIYEVG